VLNSREGAKQVHATVFWFLIAFDGVDSVTCHGAALRVMLVIVVNIGLLLGCRNGDHATIDGVPAALITDDGTRMMKVSIGLLRH